ncbi:MAG: hypothetical protein C0622_03170 [Desulfuromonas sp.]|nr:MAG: hypothetical protein C0622_03170 [Desulfuromonas sp.]
MFGFKKLRRKRLRNRPFPPEWEAILRADVAYFERLPAAEQDELRGHIQIFLAEKSFEGCGGLTIDDRMRVVIAAQACILLLHRETDYYPTLQSILVYPHPFSSQITQRDGAVVTVKQQGRLGESWLRGPVILAWDDVTHSAHDARDGHNVVFHEFAHQLDGEWGGMEGAPALPQASMYSAWARILGEEYEELIADLKFHRDNDLDAYGATNPAEFFAVITEAFFEKPRQLQKRHPQLYEQLSLFYAQDPANYGH